MGKTSNFKVQFTENILKDKYHMTQKGIDGFWKNKTYEREFNNKKGLAIAVGIGEAMGTAVFAHWDAVTSGDCTVPIVVFGGIAVLTTAIAVLKKNPYTKEEYAEIDEDYEKEKAKKEKVMRK